MPLIQAIMEGFFKDKLTWSLLFFLQYREKEYDFMYDRRQEHKLYKKSLEVCLKITFRLENVFLGLKLSIFYYWLRWVGSRTRICSSPETAM